MKKGFMADDSEKLKKQLHEVHKKECKDPEELERKNKATDLGIDLADLYPLTMIAVDHGSVINKDDPNDEGHPTHPTDKGLQMVMIDADWIGARAMEFQAAGDSEQAAKRKAAECAFTSFVMMMSRLIHDFVMASRDWNCEEKSETEVAAVLMCDAMREARNRGIPSGIIKMWAAPVMLGCLDRNDFDELIQQFKDKLSQKEEEKKE